MNLGEAELGNIRGALAAIPGDVAHDAVGAYAPKLHEMYAPETHAAALDSTTPIVLGARGTGKSFWAGVLGDAETRKAANLAYPRLGLANLDVGFGFTSLGGPGGISVDALRSCVPEGAETEASARAFWWATVLHAAARASGTGGASLSSLAPSAENWETREQLLGDHEARLRESGRTLLIIYDALDTVAVTWPRRRLLTQTLLEVVWGMRAYSSIRLKLFLRPDQIEDDELHLIELPKLRTGAVRLQWSAPDLYGLFYARLALAPAPDASAAFSKILASEGVSTVNQKDILARRWRPGNDSDLQRRVMAKLAGQFMAEGAFGYKKGNTYDWPFAHLADAFGEVTPRSFLGLLIAAAKYGPAPADRVITPDGIRHGLRAASKTRVDQLHLEFAWIKAVLAPLAGLLLPQEEGEVFHAWRRAKTLTSLRADAESNGYLPPFPMNTKEAERDLFRALEGIGVMFRRKDGRIDMPDLFRVAAKLLKKGGTAPL